MFISTAGWKKKYLNVAAASVLIHYYSKLSSIRQCFSIKTADAFVTPISYILHCLRYI
jgi:hypothetical protein